MPAKRIARIKSAFINDVVLLLVFNFKGKESTKEPVSCKNKFKIPATEAANRRKNSIVNEKVSMLLEEERKLP